MVEEDAFAARIARHEPALRTFLRQRMSPRLRLLESLSDLLQSVYCDLWQRRAALPNDSADFERYAVMAANHKATDKARHYGRQRRNAARTTALGEAEPAASGSANCAAHAVEFEEDCVRLAHVASRTLSKSECEAFIRCVLQGESTAAVAAEIDERPNTVSVRVHRAMAKLALTLETRAGSERAPIPPIDDQA